MRTRRRRTKTRTGAELVILTLLLAGGALLPAADLAQKDKDSDSAVVAGTVFREPGFMLPGAEVTLTVAEASPNAKKFKPQKAVSDSRGEFAFRVPPYPSKYLVSAKARGYVQQEKTVEVAGGPQRVDVYLELKPAP